MLAGVAAIGLAGCGSNVEPGFVAKQWAGEMRELQIQPVFPPREDFQVGDIYLPAVAQADVKRAFDDAGYLPISVWLMEAGDAQQGRGSRDALKSFYENRSTYPQTSKQLVKTVEQSTAAASTNGNNGGNGGGNGGGGNGGGDNGGGDNGDGSNLSGPVPQPMLDCEDVSNGSGTSCNIFTDTENTSMRRMRIVGFPTFLSTTITKGNLSAFVPVEAFSAALGLDIGDVEAVSVSVPVAESVGLPAMRAFALAKTSISSKSNGLCPGKLRKSNASDPRSAKSTDAVSSTAKTGGTGQQTGSGDPSAPESGDSQRLGAIAALLPAGQRNAAGQVPDTFHAIVVSEVFYTRAIEISINTQQSFGLGARLQTLDPSSLTGAASKAGQQTQQSGENDDETTGEGQKTAARGTPVPSPVDTYNRLLQSTSNLPSAPGGSLQIVSVADGKVGMRRIFDRPIAIGYRGLSLSVDSTSCAIVGGASVSDMAGPLGTTFGTDDAGNVFTRSSRNAATGSRMNLPLVEDKEPAEM